MAQRFIHRNFRHILATEGIGCYISRLARSMCDNGALSYIDKPDGSRAVGWIRRFMFTRV